MKLCCPSLAFKVSSRQPLNWSASVDCCSWEGISCGQDDGHQRVVGLWLPGRGLTGLLPSDLLSSLSNLQVLDLSSNNFSGNIPDQISNLPNLEKLNLCHNHLSGRVPGSFQSLLLLSSFSVAYNDLQGLVRTIRRFLLM
ncbi:PREDICTED: tyrosine-sulfated glycopeptide receptor 1-like [Prunus mume]|uniref:Tyrosine-sulfated glycopeptide receptor 1-like n=1 Tax=Prunus mume TaxID=102107 RepID=A0ABM0NPY6_PRUMU|nr:PREDICTED: tyrosine-sulfated glycopeptide receptor 1-like [Prunus mume]